MKIDPIFQPRLLMLRSERQLTSSKVRSSQFNRASRQDKQWRKFLFAMFSHLKQDYDGKIFSLLNLGMIHYLR